MAKNKARKNKANDQKKTKAAAAAESQISEAKAYTEVQKSEASAEKAPEKKAKQQSSAEKTQEILYQVKTKRDSGVIKAYITFTYRVFHPKVTARMVLYGLLIFIPGFFVKIQALKIFLWAIGGLVVLLGLFRQYISLALTKRSDEDYRNGTEFVYEFTQNNASFFRDGELTAYSNKYKSIDAVFHDEDYYYLSLQSREFFVIPKDAFTIGDPSTFGDFMYKRCKKVCRWIPARFSNRLKKRQSQRAIAKEQLKK